MPDMIQEAIPTDFSSTLRNMEIYLANRYPNINASLKDNFKNAVKSSSAYSIRVLLLNDLAGLKIGYHGMYVHNGKNQNLYIVTGTHKKADNKNAEKENNIYFLVEAEVVIDADNPITAETRIKNLLDSDSSLYDLNIGYKATKIGFNLEIIPLQICSNLSMDDTYKNYIMSLFRSFAITDVEKTTSLEESNLVKLSLNSKFSSMLQQSHPLLIVKLSHFCSLTKVVRLKLLNKLSDFYEILNFGMFVNRYFNYSSYDNNALNVNVNGNNNDINMVEDDLSLNQIIEKYSRIHLNSEFEM